MAFPTSHANGTIYTNAAGNKYQYITNNSGWRKYKPSNTEVSYLDTNIDVLGTNEALTAQKNLGLSGTQYGPGQVTIHTVSGTHTYDPDTLFAMVYAIGAGGGGAGGSSTTGNASAGNGGEGGGIGVKLVDVATQGIKTATITIGAGGSNGYGAASGGDGANTDYNDGTYIFGGRGGQGGNVPQDDGLKNLRTANSSLGSTNSANVDFEFFNCNDHFNGFSCGDSGNADVPGANKDSLGGAGGYSFFAAGQAAKHKSRATGTEVTNAVAVGSDLYGYVGYGYGGGGASTVGNSSDAYGAPGGNGAVIIMEYK